MGDDKSSDGDDNLQGAQAVIPSSSPPLTGSPVLNILYGVEDIVRRLLDLPNDLHFRKFTFWWLYEADLQWMMELVTGCSETLWCLDTLVFIRPPVSSIQFCARVSTNIYS